MTSRWDPFAEVAWRPDIDSGTGEPWFAPAVDILEEDECVLVMVELPGMRSEDVTVDFEDHVVTIRGEHRREHEDHRAGYHRRERSYGVFARAFALPDTVEVDEAVAVMAEGVLTVRIPKREPHSMSPSSIDALRRAS